MQISRQKDIKYEGKKQLEWDEKYMKSKIGQEKAVENIKTRI